MVHGISIRNRDNNKLVSFIKCGFGREALMVLSGVRRNLGSSFVATEDEVTQTEIDNMEKS